MDNEEKSHPGFHRTSLPSNRSLARTRRMLDVYTGMFKEVQRIAAGLLEQVEKASEGDGKLSAVDVERYEIAKKLHETLWETVRKLEEEAADGNTE